MSTYVLLAFAVALILVILWNVNSEQFHNVKGSVPSFLYPTDIPQPSGPQGWGYRDPQATYQTLRWEQTRPVTVMPNPNERAKPTYVDLAVPSAPVTYPPKKRCIEIRPPVPKVTQRAVAQAPYASWD